MAVNVNLGTPNAQNDFDDTMSLYVYPGDTVTVKVNSGGTVSYYDGGLNNAASGTITSGSTHNFTAHSFLVSASTSELHITGGSYGV